MYDVLIEKFRDDRKQRIQARYLKYLEESHWRPSNKLVEACAENKSYFDTGVGLLEGFSVPLILRYNLRDGQPHVMELVLVFDIRRSNRGAILRGYSPLYDTVLYYREEDIAELRQGCNNAPIASFDAVSALYARCAAPEHKLLRAELNALLYLSLQDSVMQECELLVVRKYLASKQLPPDLTAAFQFYFETSFITPEAFAITLELLRQIPIIQREVLLDTALDLIQANGGISPWEKKAFDALLSIA